MKRLATLFIALAVFALPQSAFAFLGSFSQGTVPRAACQIAEQIDSQILARLGETPGGRRNVMLVSTVSVSLNNLEESSPLSRQISEEVMNQLIAKGYRVNELRKGKEVVMKQRQGEMLLTRDVNRLATRDVASVAVLTGTYVVTPKNVRFNMRLISTPANEVLAMGSATVPVTEELHALLADRKKGVPQPSVYTRLP